MKRTLPLLGICLLSLALPSSDPLAAQPGSACTPALTANPNSPITDFVTTNSTIATGVLPAGTSLSDLDVYVNITHTWSNDLTITLESPGGTIVNLVSAQCGSADNCIVEFDDAAAAFACPMTVASFKHPEAPGFLSDFNDELFEGNWTLHVFDGASGDSGTLISWCLMPTTYVAGVPGATCTGAYTSSPFVPIPDVSNVSDDIVVSGAPDGATLLDLNVFVDLEHTFLGDLAITLTSPSATVVTLYANDCGANANMTVEFDDSGDPSYAQRRPRGSICPSTPWWR